MEEDKIRQYMENALWALEWIIRFYIIIVVSVLIYDFNAHPELYTVIGERPVKQMTEQGIPLQANPYEIIPEYMYSASTMEECKPLQSLNKFYDRWLKPFLWMIILYALLALILKLNIKKTNEKEIDTKAKQEKEMP